MIPRIKSLKARTDYKLEVLFDDGKKVIYDVSDDINTLENFKDLVSVKGLWLHYTLDASRTCISWNDYIDLPSDTIYEYGTTI